MQNHTAKFMAFVLFILFLYSSVYSMVNVQDFGATGNPQQNATDEIQDAIDSLSGAGTVFFPKGMYQIFDTIEVPSGVTIAGEGWGSVVCTLQKDLTMFKTDDGATGVQFRDICIKYDPTCTGGDAFQIEGINSVHMKLFNVKLEAPSNRVHAGVRTWDGVDSSDSATDSGWMTHIESCYIKCGGIWLKQSDNRILKNVIETSDQYGTGLPFAIRIDYKGNTNISDNQITPAYGTNGTDGGVCLNRSYLNRIQGNHFKGDVTVPSQWGLYGKDTYWTTIQGNTFENLSGGIFLENAHFNVLQSNVFKNNNCNDLSTNDDIKLNNDSFAGSGLIISSNLHYQERQLQNPSKAVNVVGSYGCDTQIDNNSAYGDYASPVFNNIRNSKSSLKNNSVNLSLSKRTGTVVVSKNTNMKFVDFWPPFDVAPKYSEMHVQLERISTINPPTYMLSGMTNAGVWIVFGQNLTEDLNVHWRCEIE